MGVWPGEEEELLADVAFVEADGEFELLGGGAAYCAAKVYVVGLGLGEVYLGEVNGYIGGYVLCGVVYFVNQLFAQGVSG